MNDFSYKKLIVWQKGMLLLKSVYVLTEALPKSEEYILKSQLRRAAVSVVSNIAEGSGRNLLLKESVFMRLQGHPESK